MTSISSTRPASIDSGSASSTLRIIPVRPEPPSVEDLVTSPADLRSTPSRRTFGRKPPSRRTFGRRIPSRRTFGRRVPSRRTFARKFPSRRTFARRWP